MNIYFILLFLLICGCSSTTGGVPIARVPTKITSYPLKDYKGELHKYRDNFDSFIFPQDNKKLTQYCAFHFHWEDIRVVYRKDDNGEWNYIYIVSKNKKSFKK
tara:strand:+ start:262 stop:570 length:309 start_codon:yes stop_codon:yes gene_type:complete